MANRDPKFPWFRTYADIVDNAKIRLLAFEDRWHFVALCALKCDGLLEERDDHLFERKIALKLGVQIRELDEIKRRLMEVDLIDDGFQPKKWEMRQHRKSTLPDGETLEGYKGYVYFIGSKPLKTVKIGFSKNPWARVKDLQTGRSDKLAVVATVKTTEVSEKSIHDLFEDERRAGEWFDISHKLQGVISAIKEKKVRDASDVVNYVCDYVATTKETEPDTDTDTEEDISPKGDCASGDALKPEHVVEEWNKIAPKLGKPLVRKITPARRQLLKARIAQYELDDFVTVFAKSEKSKFLRGDTGWHGFSFDWVFKQANFQKVIEGNYDG